jgi:hypothetical protein
MDEFDFDLDQSDRVARRIAHGAYRIAHNGASVGEELWGILALRGGGYRLMSEIDLRWPVPNKQRSRLDLDPKWLAIRLWVQIDAEGKRRIAHYVPSAGMLEVSVDEEALGHADNGRGRPSKDQAYAPAAANPRRTYSESSLYDENATFLDFGSTLFNFAHLRRLNLGPGQQVQVRTVVATQPSLRPLVIEQIYAYVRDEQITTQLQPFLHSRRYRIEELGEGRSAPVTTLWTDAHGVALKQDVQLGKEVHGCELISYAWIGEES